MSTRNLVLIALLGLALVLAYDLFAVRDVAEAPGSDDASFVAVTAEALPESADSGSADSAEKDEEAESADSDGISSSDTAVESPVTYLPLAPPANARDLEYSGMSWFDEQLVLLPQYPDVVLEEADGADDHSEGTTEAVTGTQRAGRVYALELSDLLAAVSGNEDPLVAQEIPFSYPSAVADLDGFEGFEAIAFEGDRVYLTVEAQTDETTKGYLVAGTVTRGGDGRMASIALDDAAPVEVELPANLDNMSLESIQVDGGNITTFFEANGATVNAEPKAFGFDASLGPIMEWDFPTIEYRVTDATEMDASGTFWVINYHFPGEDELLQPQADQLIAEYGEGPTHALFDHVERIVELAGGEGAIQFPAPTGRVIQLELVDAETSRNWEGIARLEDRGFLLVTDKYPETILGFVAMPAGDR